MKNIDVLRLWSNYLAALRNEVVVGQNWERGRTDQQSYNVAAAKLYYLSQEVEDAILTGPIERLAQLLWGVGTTALAKGGGRLSQKHLKPDEPFLLLLARFSALREMNGPEVGVRIWGITQMMHEMHADHRVDIIAESVKRSLMTIRVPRTNLPP